ncbi:MAG: carbohydrate kinase family protein [Aestuariivirga sp.]|nr:carbohydrate kinase family protein [Aestuariivirga sp.]
MGKTQRRGFITGGTWCVDNNRMVTHWPGEDGHAQFIEEERHGGGSGCNFALNIKRLDSTMPVETITIVGDDEHGRFLRSLAQNAGVGHAQMHVTANASTQWTDAFVSKASGRRTHIFNSGASLSLTPDHFDFSSTNARYLHLGLPGMHQHLDRPWQGDANGWVTVLKRARAADLKTNMELASIDAEQLAELVRPCLAHLDLIIVNDGEIGALSGIDTLPGGVTDVAACQRAARHVLENGAMDIVVVHCPVIAIAVTRDGKVFTKPSTEIPRELVAGANGAGDAFAAGMLYGLHEEWSIDDALTLAHASAAASLRSLSTTGAVEPWRKCLELANEWGWRKAS